VYLASVERGHSSNDGRSLGSYALRFRKCLQALVSFPEPVEKVQKNPPAGPSVGSDRTVPLVVLDLGRHPMLRPALIIDLLVLVLHSHRDIKIDDFQAKVPVDDKVVGLDIPVSDTAHVKIRDAFDEAQADLNNLAFKPLRPVLNVTFGR
jgi:hypothetical protein